MAIRVEPNNLFATYKSQNELMDYFDKHSGSEKALLIMGAMLMNNLIAHCINTSADEAEQHGDK